MRKAIDAGRARQRSRLASASSALAAGEYFASDPWRGKWATEGGGVMMNQAVHAIDLLQWFMGPAAEVYGKIATLRHGDYIDVEDTVAATVVFECGALGTIEALTHVSAGFRLPGGGPRRQRRDRQRARDSGRDAGGQRFWTFEPGGSERAAWAEARTGTSRAFPSSTSCRSPSSWMRFEWACAGRHRRGTRGTRWRSFWGFMSRRGTGLPVQLR